jgi:3-deoxy-D-manno-octulosonic-acid transferase
MFSQKELAARVLAAKAGMQVTYDTLPTAVETFFNSPREEALMVAAARDLVASGRGASQATFRMIEAFMEYTQIT